MTSSQGRRDDAGTWISTAPVGVVLALLLAVGTFAGVQTYRYRAVWTAAQRAAWRPYLRHTVRAAMNVNPQARAEAQAEADTLRTWVYGGRQIWRVVQEPLLVALAVLAGGLVVAVPRDLRRARARRHGRRLKGAALVTAEAFAAAHPANGWGITLTGGAVLRIPRPAEASHAMITGDSGSGKTTLIKMALCQIRDRGEAAIVVDPKGEFLPLFFDAARGDQVLNPLDARCPDWSPGAEVRVDEEALTLAAGLFQPSPREDPFFHEWARKVFAQLLRRRPSAADLVRWMGDGRRLDVLLAGTPAAAAIDPQAHQQRGGVLASLNRVADTLALVPAAKPGRATWSAAAWAQAPTGWLFITAAPTTREVQTPLMTLWIDMLILRLMTGRTAASPKVWLVIDEVASLRKVPQLQTAITESRSANLAMILGFQARGQIRALYGEGFAEAMLSQPATKLVLRSSEPEAAKWLAELLGREEVERIRLSRSRSFPARWTASESLEREEKPVVTASEIEGLADRTGYVKHGNDVVPVRFPYLDLPTVAPGFMPRAQAAVPLLVLSQTPPPPRARPPAVRRGRFAD